MNFSYEDYLRNAANNFLLQLRSDSNACFLPFPGIIVANFGQKEFYKDGHHGVPINNNDDLIEHFNPDIFSSIIHEYFHVYHIIGSSLGYLYFHAGYNCFKSLLEILEYLKSDQQLRDKAKKEALYSGKNEDYLPETLWQLDKWNMFNSILTLFTSSIHGSYIPKLKDFVRPLHYLIEWFADIYTEEKSSNENVQIVFDTIAHQFCTRAESTLPFELPKSFFKPKDIKNIEEFQSITTPHKSIYITETLLIENYAKLQELYINFVARYEHDAPLSYDIFKKEFLDQMTYEYMVVNRALFAAVDSHIILTCNS